MAAAGACFAIVASSLLVAPGSVVPAAAATDFLTGGAFVSDSSARAQPSQSLPGRYGSYRDQVFGTTVRQLTASGDPGTGFVPEYSKAGAFNADGSRFLVRGTDASTWLYNGYNLQEIERLPIPEADLEPRWSPTDPNTLTYLDNGGPGEIKQYSLATGESTVLGTYAGFGGLSSGAEQDRSRSGRYYALHGTEVYSGDRFVSTQAFVADLQTGARGPVTTLTPPSPGDFLDYVAITPDDNYVMVMWAGAGARLYTRDWAFVRALTNWDEHADFCRTPAGEDALVIAHYRADPNDEVVEYVPLSGAPSRVLWQAPAYNMALHISCRNTGLPGWVFLSSYWDGLGQRPGLTAFENEVFAMSLDSTQAAPIVRRLAHTGMVERADYFDEPHATVRRDGRVVLFASNFERYQSSDSFADTFAIDLRDGVEVPPALGTQSPAGSVVRKLRVGRRANLPARTTAGQRIWWRSATPGACRVVKSKSKPTVKARARGRCQVVATAPATSAFAALSARYRIKIVR